jgi:hypothetical protein
LHPKARKPSAFDDEQAIVFHHPFDICCSLVMENGQCWRGTWMSAAKPSMCWEFAAPPTSLLST